MNLKALSDAVNGRWSPDQVDLIWRRCTDEKAGADDLAQFLMVAHSMNLDPLRGEIRALFRWDKNKGQVMAIQTGIDGYRKVADGTGSYAGNDEPVYEGLVDGQFPAKATVTVWRMVAGQRVPFTAHALWPEYVQTGKDKKPTRMWARMPHLMLAKCAEALALRKAFPGALSGVYTHEEMGQADNESNAASQSASQSRSSGAQRTNAKRAGNQSPGAKKRAPEPLQSENTNAQQPTKVVTKADLAECVRGMRELGAQKAANTMQAWLDQTDWGPAHLAAGLKRAQAVLASIRGCAHESYAPDREGVVSCEVCGLEAAEDEPMAEAMGLTDEELPF